MGGGINQNGITPSGINTPAIGEAPINGNSGAETPTVERPSGQPPQDRGIKEILIDNNTSDLENEDFKGWN